MSCDLLIAIPTKGRAGALTDLLGHLSRQQGSLRREVLVVDNGSDDATRRVVAQLATTFPVPLRYCREGVAGVARARNRAVAEAEATWIAYLDDDVIPDPDWTAALERSLTELGDAAAIGGRVLPRWEAPPPPWLRGRLAERLGVFDFGDAVMPLHWPMWLSGANMVFRVDALRRAGLFCTRLGHRGSWPLSGEEPELCRRVLAGGGSIYYDPRLRVVHRMEPESWGLRAFLRRVYWIGCAGALIDAAYAETSSLWRGARRQVAALLRPARIARCLRGGGGFDRVSLADDAVCAMGYCSGLVLARRSSWRLRPQNQADPANPAAPAAA